MRTNIIKGDPASALSLGTVQLGLNYGVNSSSGKPDEEKLKTLAPSETPFVVTKVKHLDHGSLEALRESVREQVERSKRRLGLKQIPLLMIHDCDEYLCDMENMTRVFRELKESGDIRFSGISAYSHHDYGKIAASGFAQYRYQSISLTGRRLKTAA